ncbi:hypothetical protein F511_06033 [Dorcoceras hygrometricum]|uniref:Uncharacterized protein n=1 Tax=Dorcoceras hygrometricum TaxID=472368 RepID=A0A2Z7B3I7_9LAMI|nr:hypothetical protein F511_06033 [Dorcoceras hygrometricum]
MANQGTNTGYTGHSADQPQLRRDDLTNQPSNLHNQAQSNFLQETGTQVMSMAQGAAEIGKGAAQGAVNLAKGAALGAANIAQGAAGAVKNTLGINTPDPSGTACTADTNLPADIDTEIGGSTNPSSINHPINPSTRI